MKKIYCKYVPDDYLHITIGGDDVWVDIKQDNTVATFALCPDQIRKLRKQLKRALVKIEGVEPNKAQDEEYKPGDRVYLIEGNGEGKDWCTSPTVVDIDLSVPVELKEKLSAGKWVLKYKMIDGHENTGYAYEKSFGRRA